MRRLAGQRKAGGKVGCWERAPLRPAQHREPGSLCWAEKPAAKAFGDRFYRILAFVPPRSIRQIRPAFQAANNCEEALA